MADELRFARYAWERMNNDQFAGGKSPIAWLDVRGDIWYATCRAAGFDPENRWVRVGRLTTSWGGHSKGVFGDRT